MAKAYGDVTQGRDIDINSAESVSEHLLHSARANFTDMLQFVHYPDYDSYTVGHSVRVATLVVFVGDQFGLNDKQLLELGTAALLHDIGKSKIPSEILTTLCVVRLVLKYFSVPREIIGYNGWILTT